MARVDAEYEDHMQKEYDMQQIEEERRWDELMNMARQRGLVLVPADWRKE